MDITVNGLKEKNEGSKSVTNGHAIADLSYKQINEKLEKITRYLEQEIECKQKAIEEQRIETEQLKKDISHKSAVISGLKQQLDQSAQNTEGHRQLINKLLNDIEHLQNDIDWYKRTYERRSLWGVLKEKLTKKK
jgi:septal ring factor EnvC (AmiA/AmiB activator)